MANRLDLKSMMDVLHNERIAVLDGKAGREREAWALAWATSCAQEAITVWRSVHPQMEREMLAELIKTSK